MQMGGIPIAFNFVTDPRGFAVRGQAGRAEPAADRNAEALGPRFPVL